jgi:acetyltransferase-like isoleucine patch superfamily enzyme
MTPTRFLKLAGKAIADLLALCDPVFIAIALRRAANAARAQRRFRAAGASIAAGAAVVSLERLEIGAGAFVQSGCLLHCGGLDWSDGKGRIRLGKRAYIGHDSVLYGSGDLDIGNDVLIGPGVILTSQGHRFDAVGLAIREQPLLFAPVCIGDDVWIGAGAVVLPGVRIGNGAVVAGGAVVNRDVAAFEVVAGVPAQVLKKRPHELHKAASEAT